MSEDTPAPAPQHEPVPASKPWFKKKRFIIPGGIVAAIFVAAALSDPPAEDTSVSAVASDATTTSPSRAEEVVAEEEPVETTTTTTTTVKPKPPASKTYTGRGDKILKIAKPDEGALLAAMSYKGGGNFAVWTLDGASENDLMVNTIGSYSGTVLLDENGEETKRLKIEAEGAWKVTLKQSIAAPKFGPGKAIAGKGDAVWIYTGSEGVVNLTHKGQSNFAVSWIPAEGDFGDLLANEIGNYKGEDVIDGGPGVLTFETDGKWTAKVTE